MRDAQAILKQTEPHRSDPKLAREPLLLVLRRNSLALQIRLSQWQAGVELRARALLADMDRQLGPGNDMAAGLRIELGRLFTDMGDYDKALAQRAENLAVGRSGPGAAGAAGASHPQLPGAGPGAGACRPHPTPWRARANRWPT